jgi:hypothetical protein
MRRLKGAGIRKTILETFVLLLQNNQHLTSLNWVLWCIVAKLDKLMHFISDYIWVTVSVTLH